MSDPTRTRLRLTDLATRTPTPFEIVPDAEARAALAQALDLRGLRKLRFAGTLAPLGRADWRLEATLGATVVQDCVITLDPVTTRIDEDVTRIYAADLPDPEGTEVEMTQDDTIDPLPSVLDLAEVMEEALALALPAFPKTPEAELAEASATPPGSDPIEEAETRPFASLAALRDKLGGDGGSEG